MAKPLTKKAKSLIAVIAVLAAAAVVAVGANAVYIFSARQKVSGYIRSITLVENVQQEEYLAQYVGTTIGETYRDEANEVYAALSDAQKAMTFNTEQYNVYRIEAVFNDPTDINVSFWMAGLCRENQYMVATDLEYNSISAGTQGNWVYYVFVSKEYTLQDIENDLETNGTEFRALFQRERSGGYFNVTAKYTPQAETNA